MIWVYLVGWGASMLVIFLSLVLSFTDVSAIVVPYHFGIIATGYFIDQIIEIIVSTKQREDEIGT